VTLLHFAGAQSAVEGVLPMDERLRFVARLLDGEKMAALCREFDVSRKTGYKIFQLL
jgi:transposase-like protein